MKSYEFSLLSSNENKKSILPKIIVSQIVPLFIGCFRIIFLAKEVKNLHIAPYAFSLLQEIVFKQKIRAESVYTERKTKQKDAVVKSIHSSLR